MFSFSNKNNTKRHVREHLSFVVISCKRDNVFGKPSKGLC